MFGGCSDSSSRESLPTASIRGDAEEPAPSRGRSGLPGKGESRSNETWDAHYLVGTQVGHCRTREQRFEEDGVSLVRIESRNVVQINRAGQPSEHVIENISIETESGELLRFETRLRSGSTTTEFRGRVEGGELVVETSTAGKVSTSRASWPGGTGGLFAMEQSLRRRPLVAGERRTVTGLLPIVNQAVEIELTADKVVATRLLEHSEDLLRVECRAKLAGGQPIAEQLWINRQGVILKRRIDALNQETYRVNKHVALAEIGQARFDLMLDTTVPTDRAIERPHSTQRIRYRLRVTSGDPATLFAQDRRQEIDSLDTRTAELTVRAVQPDIAHADSKREPKASDSPASALPPTPILAERVPTEADREANNLIQSDNPKIVSMARSIVPDESDPWKLALALARAVKRHIRHSDYSQPFASAADVLEHAEGDCTEHAVLLAALCRARGIPALVAIGLVYVPEARGFAYHMWNEVWIAGSWFAIDSTLDTPTVGAAHLKVADSGLQGTEAYTMFLSVAKIIGQITIEIIEVE
jgi:transglutaminase-like putative cysteine protease